MEKEDHQSYRRPYMMGGNPGERIRSLQLGSGKSNTICLFALVSLFESCLQ